MDFLIYPLRSQKYELLYHLKVLDWMFLSCLHSELYEKDFDGQSAIYWEVKYPFPLSNRDVSFWFKTMFTPWSNVVMGQSVFPDSVNLSMCTSGRGETWMWTAGRSGWSWPKALRRRHVQKRAACCGSKTTSRALPWRPTVPVELEVTKDEKT